MRALQQAGVEAEQRVRLEIANRYGNPSIGPAMEYNETSVTFVGAWLIYQLPVFNTHRGDIMLRRGARAGAGRPEARRDPDGARCAGGAARIAEAQRWVKYFAGESLPALEGMMASFEKLFIANEPGVDVLRLIDTRRRVQRARDSYLDALWELSQARADLAAAVGELSLAIGTPPVAAPAVQPADAAGARLLPPVPAEN